jgi:nucleoside-diphosphate-sugar epimerase
MKLLLTGATGFLGSNLAKFLLDNGHSVVVLKRSFSNVSRITDIASKLKFYDIDCCQIENVFKEQHIDVVIHTATCYGRNNEPFSLIVDTNIIFTLKLLECAINFNTDTFFNTDTILNKYLDLYTLSKKQTVEWLKKLASASKIKIVNMRLEYLFGTGDNVKFIPWLLSQLKQNVSEIKLTKGEQERDFIYVDDVVQAYNVVLNNVDKLEKWTEFDVGTGNPIPLKNFVLEVDRQYKQKYPLNKTKLLFGAIDYRENEIMKITIDVSPLKKLGWTAHYNFSSAIEKLLQEEY